MRPIRSLLLAACGALLAAAAVGADPAPAQLPPSDQAVAFLAAGFRQEGGKWRKCEDPTPSYSPGAVELVRDLNGDGRPEAVLVEGGTFCYGNTGQGYWLVTQQADGSWKLVTNGIGILLLLETKGAAGWPDIQIGGPGFCFPVERFDGKAYVFNRNEYEGKPCKSE